MSELKFWNGRSPKSGWEHCYIAAYSEKDAIQLYDEAFGHGGRGEIRTHFSNCWGSAAERELLPTATRGVYLTDQNCHSRTFLPPKSRSIVDEAPEAAQAAAAEQAIPKEYGKLRVGFSRGVRIDVWTYESPHHDRAHADQMTAEIRMVNSDRRSRVVDRTGIEFQATSKCWDGTLSSSNIEALFEKVQEGFRTFDLSRRGIVWEDWIEVKLRPDQDWDSKHDHVSTGLTLMYKIIKRGVDPRDRKKIYTLGEWGGVSPFPSPKAAGAKDSQRDDYGGRDREEDHQYAYIPATPENRAALDRIIAKMTELRTRLEGLLRHDVIAKELASISTNLLAAPNDD